MAVPVLPHRRPLQTAFLLLLLAYLVGNEIKRLTSSAHRIHLIKSLRPTSLPTLSPSIQPSTLPTLMPTIIPTALPTLKPTAIPTALPTLPPSSQLPCRLIHVREVQTRVVARERRRRPTTFHMRFSVGNSSSSSSSSRATVTTSRVRGTTTTTNPRDNFPVARSWRIIRVPT